MSWEGIGVIVTAVGVLLTWLHSRKSRKIAKEALEVEKSRREDEKERQRRLEEERKKADFSAQYGKGLAPNWREETLALHNTGQAEARNIRVLIEGEALQESEWAVDGLEPESRMSRSPGGQPLYVPLDVAPGETGTLSVEVVWDDDFGRDRKKQVDVQL